MTIQDKITLKEDCIGYLMENARVAFAKGNLEKAKAYFHCIIHLTEQIESLKNQLKVHQEMQQIASQIYNHQLVWELFPNIKKDR